MKESLELVTISVHESIIRKALNRRVLRRKPLLSKETLLRFAKEHLDTPKRYWEKVLWTYKAKDELSGKNTQHCEGSKKARNNSRKTPSQQ